MVEDVAHPSLDGGCDLVLRYTNVGEGWLRLGPRQQLCRITCQRPGQPQAQLAGNELTSVLAKHQHRVGFGALRDWMVAKGQKRRGGEGEPGGTEGLKGHGRMDTGVKELEVCLDKGPYAESRHGGVLRAVREVVMAEWSYCCVSTVLVPPWRVTRLVANAPEKLLMVTTGSMACS